MVDISTLSEYQYRCANATGQTEYFKVSTTLQHSGKSTRVGIPCKNVLF